ncbi:MAG: hypothetical protein HY042_02430 [Spirochaetia bacterium]|nr:hypothetical protein [Spirochaetia bacterium]
MRHWIEEIRTDTRTLPSDARAHIDECGLCRTEYRLMHAIETGLMGLPLGMVPAAMRRRVMEGVAAVALAPAYKTWQLLIAVIVTIVSPIALARSKFLGIDDDATAVLFGLYGVLTVLVVLPISFQLFSAYRKRFEKLERDFDAVLDHPIKEIGRMLKKPS